MSTPTPPEASPPQGSPAEAPAGAPAIPEEVTLVGIETNADAGPLPVLRGATCLRHGALLWNQMTGFKTTEATVEDYVRKGVLVPLTSWQQTPLRVPRTMAYVALVREDILGFLNLHLPSSRLEVLHTGVRVPLSPSRGEPRLGYFLFGFPSFEAYQQWATQGEDSPLERALAKAQALLQQEALVEYVASLLAETDPRVVALTLCPPEKRWSLSAGGAFLADKVGFLWVAKFFRSLAIRPSK